MKKRNIFKYKNYTHFDNRKNYKECIGYITNKKCIEKHNFYPFIHFTIKFKKYDGIKIKDKEREIYYSSHRDRYIYQYYGNKLNNLYNKYVKNKGINKVATAYRTNLQRKSNIHFAKEIIDFICKQECAFIYVGDFTSFFDNLNHDYLKLMICNLFSNKYMPSDYYAIYKSMTKYSFIEKEDILTYKDIDQNEFRKLDRVFDDLKEFRKFKSKHIKANEIGIGIPQGSSVSTVYSNIYMLDFDKMINDYATSNKGMYRRYSDDLIMVIPMNIEDINSNNYYKHTDKVKSVVDIVPNLILNQSKTGKYVYNLGQIYNLDSKKEDIIDYLGFTFNGKDVKIREKSLGKYYYRMYKKVRSANKITSIRKKNSFRKRLYGLYSHLGAKKKRKKGYGNFLSYVYRCQEVFDNNSYTNNMMKYQVKNHWRKIDSRLLKLPK